MKLRDLRNLPVYCREIKGYPARVDHGMVDENFRLRYLAVKKSDGAEAWIAAEDLTLTEERAEISHPACMKTGLEGNNLSIYEKKTGDRVHDAQGGQIGNISDFILDPFTEKVTHLEVTRGYFSDFLYGRLQIPLASICFESTRCVRIRKEEGEGHVLSTVPGNPDGNCRE